MHIVGIIAEYNPFHNGHLHQIVSTRKQTHCDYIVVAMSGNFTQRGEAAIVDKFVRTQMALKAGVDLVLELPVPFATASAERFAQGAVSLFHQTGIVETLSFGSECGDTTLLELIAKRLETPSPTFKASLKKHLKKSYSFPRAREQALLEDLKTLELDSEVYTSLLELIRSPNNILGIEYIRAIEHFSTTIQPFTIKRLTAGYHDPLLYPQIASATAIRTHLSNGYSSELAACMPSTTYELLDNTSYHQPDMDILTPFLHHKFMFSNKKDLYSLWDIPNDLINTFLNNYTSFEYLSELVKACTSKTYTSATVRRALLRLLLDIQDEALKQFEAISWIPYIRVLGCKKESAAILKHLNYSANRPIITNLSRVYADLDPLSKQLIDYELNATKLYHYLTKQPKLYNQDFTQGFLML